MPSSKPTFLTETYSGFLHRDVPTEDVDLTHVGPGTPTGEYLRRFWQPVAHSDELNDLPVRIRILGEDLVAFRDDAGRAGLLELHCCHRGTSLEYGKIEDGGIRCCYHGWLFDISGKILETPGEPETSTLKDRLYHGAYPVHEFNGLVFAYMGPPDKIYPFPMYDAYTAPGMTLAVGTKNIKHCNWLQVMDNVVDPVHEAFLHAGISNVQFTDSAGQPIEALLDVGAFEVLESPIGLMCCVTRRIDGHIWSHNVEYIAPNIGHIPLPPDLPPQYNEGQDQVCFYPTLFRWRVPQDDTNTLEFTFTRTPEGQEDAYTNNPEFATMAQLAGNARPYEDRQRFPADYDAQVGQRDIAVHDLEHLATTDRGVIMMRRMIRDGIQAIDRGEDPVGIFREPITEPIPTYGYETSAKVPPAPTPEEDEKLIRDTGLGFAKGYLSEPPAQSPYLRIK